MFRSVTLLTSSSAISRLIALASLPAITRIYTPDTFGQFSIFVATLGLLLPLATLKFSDAVPLPERLGPAINLCLLCLLTTGVVAAVAATALTAVMLFAQYFGVARPATYYWLIVVGLIGVGLFETLNALALRHKQFKPMAVALMSQSISSIALKIILGLLGLKVLGLVLGHIVSMTAGVASLMRAMRRDIGKAFGLVSLRRVRVVSCRYAAFPGIRLPAQFLLAFSTQLPILYVGSIYGEKIVGQLGLALTCIAIPVSLVGASLGQVLYAEMAELGESQPERIRHLIQSVLLTSVALILVPATVLGIAAQGLFAFVFGDEWLLAGRFAQLFSLYLAVQFCAVPLINTFSVFGDQRSFLVINGVRVMLTVVAFCLSYLLQLEPISALTLFSVTLSIHYVYVIWSIFNRVNKECLKNAS